MKANTPSILTSDDLQSIEPKWFPKDSFKGVMHDAQGEYIGNVYLHRGRGFVGTPRPYGRGEVTAMLPGAFDPKAFKAIGWERVSDSRCIRQWKFREGSWAYSWKAAS